MRKIREVSTTESISTPGKVGRPLKPLAKTRDPEYRAWTGYLKTDTLTDADYLLKRKKDSRDMSDLMQELLSDWLESQPKI